MPSLKPVTVAAGFPVYSLAFTRIGISKDSAAERLILGGGGGSSKSGVRNKLCMYAVRDSTLELLRDFPLAEDEDAPMCLATHPQQSEVLAGINSLSATREGQSLRVFGMTEDDSFMQKTSAACCSSMQEHDYQRVVVCSSDGTMVATGNTDGSVRLLAWPGLNELGRRRIPDEEDFYDVDFNGDGTQLVITASRSITMWSIGTFEDVDSAPVQHISSPRLKKDMKCTFRFARFGRASTSDLLITAVNGEGGQTQPKPKKVVTRQAFLSVWEAATGNLIRTQDVGKRPITALDLSASGTLLAYASSELRVGVVDAKSLQPLLSIATVHSFPVTSIKFNLSNSRLVTGSADNTLSMFSIDETTLRRVRPTPAWLLAALACILALLVAYVQRGNQEDLQAYLSHVHL